MVMNKLILWSNVAKSQTSGVSKLGRGCSWNREVKKPGLFYNTLNYFNNTNRQGERKEGDL